MTILDQRHLISHEKPLIDPNPTLQSYYASLESRAGYKLILGGTRHFGLYAYKAWWPFPIGRALRAMEDKLFDNLDLNPGSLVLDAGCGVGHVAMHMAGKGLRVQCIDVVEHHIEKAQRNIKAAGLEEVITAQVGDYHHLEQFDDCSFDGIYTMETLVHATQPTQVMLEFLRILKPGGHIAFMEYERQNGTDASQSLKDSLTEINETAAMPTFEMLGNGAWRKLVYKNGFRHVRVEDLSEYVRPMFIFFFVLAFIPYHIICLLGLKPWFLNTVAGYHGMWVGFNGLSKYLAITAKKPES